jgi:hypothetical protein
MSEPRIQILTVRCKVGGTDADRDEMFASMRAFGDACQFVTDNTDAKMTNKGRLRKACYLPIREKFNLSANIAQQLISRVSANRKTAKTTGGIVAEYGAGSIQFDERTFCLYGEVASMTLVNGRRRVALILGIYQREQLARHAGRRRIRSAQLNARRSRRGRVEIYLNIEIEVACAPMIDSVDWRGCNLSLRRQSSAASTADRNSTSPPAASRRVMAEWPRPAPTSLSCGPVRTPR